MFQKPCTSYVPALGASLRTDMTKSKLKTKGILLLTLLVALTSFGLIWAIPRMDFKDNITIGLYFIFFIILGLTGTVYIFLRDTKKIEIDDNDITYRNWLTNVTTTYRLSELDGFTITQEITNGGLVRTLAPMPFQHRGQ
jgi:hypothetical protein